MLVNFSNHSSALWSDKQLEVAISIYGSVVDIPFPLVDPAENPDYIMNLAKQFVNKIVGMGSPESVVVHAMGELTLTFAVVAKLQSLGYICVASTTERKVTMLDDKRKEVLFEFVKFREYSMLPLVPNSTLTAEFKQS